MIIMDNLHAGDILNWRFSGQFLHAGDILNWRFSGQFLHAGDILNWNLSDLHVVPPSPHMS